MRRHRTASVPGVVRGVAAPHEDLGEDRPGDGGGDLATGLFAGALLPLDDDGDRHLGDPTLAAAVADDPGVGPGRVGAELGGTRLAPDVAVLEALVVEADGGALVDDRRHGVLERGGGRGADGGAPLVGVGLVDDLVLVVADLVDDVRRHDAPVVGHAGGHYRHLQRGGGHAVLADRQLGEDAAVLVEGLFLAVGALDR